MDKLIDRIIELILGDMDCHHEVDYDEDGAHVSVEYNLNNETKLRGMIRGLIQKPGVTKRTDKLGGEDIIEWIDRWRDYCGESCTPDCVGGVEKCEQAYDQIVTRIKKEVTEEFVEKWADKFDGVAQQGLIINIDLLKQMLKEAGVEVIPS